MQKHFTHRLAFLVIVGSALSISILAPRTATAQERVPRLLMVPASDGGSAALAALQSDQSNVLVAGDIADPAPLPFAPFQDCDAVRATLAANLNASPDDPQVVELADALCAALTNAVFYEQQAMHVRRGGIDSLSILFEGGAPSGAVTVTGPDGDVLVLGNFLIYHITTANDSDCDRLGYCNTWAVTANPDQANLSVGLAIGLFTR